MLSQKLNPIIMCSTGNIYFVCMEKHINFLTNRSTFLNLDSSLYAHYVFKAFDVNCNGAISFRDHIVTLSTLLRGSVYERLKWTFKLYDLNGDGCISRGELTEVVQAVHELMGRRIADDDRKTREQVRLICVFSS